jgi:hypothetical protein
LYQFKDDLAEFLFSVDPNSLVFHTTAIGHFC